MKDIENFKCECGGNIFKLEDGYECNKCKLQVYNKFMGRTLSCEEVHKLFSSDMIEFNNIKTKDGYRINAIIYSNDMKLHL